MENSMFQTRDPDDGIVVIFKNMAAKNEGKTIEAGRPIYDDIEVCELHYPGSKNFGVYPSTAFSHWVDGPDGERVKLTYAERFKRQYQQFKSQAQQTTTGTPLAYATFLTEGKRAELRALNVYTIEALAAVDGQELKNLGAGGREWKNKAIEYLENAKVHAVDTRLMAELEALRSKNALMEEDLQRLKESRREPDEEPGADQFDNMSNEQLREFITTNTGQAPIGNTARKTLVRMARQAEPKAA
jgi:hypothetical protein